MRAEQRIFITALALRMFADRPKQSPSDWCCENLIFDEPDNRGPFTLAGREYMREPIDDWADPLITDQVEVFGSQTGKTGGIMGGAAWTSRNEPARIKWVMPTRDLVFGFSRKRWMKMLERSDTFKDLIPRGAKRHDFSTLSQIIGGAIIDFAWSNSPAALSSDPCRIVVLDEVDKFNEGGREANAVNLAEQRTKSFANPKRVKTSTPTLVTGLIWQEFLKTDQRRRYMPCPFCGKFVVFIWAKNFTVFKLTGEEAEVKWDKESKRADGTWDLDRVERSARYECPHCGGHIRDGHKTAMDRRGVWRPTANAARGYRGRQLSSLYAAGAESNVGKLAVKFLQAKNSLLGLQGFINGDLAEPYQSQDTLSDRTELITGKLEVTAEWKKLLTVDCQFKAPYFWHVIRAWNGSESHGIEAGPLDTWEEIRLRQQANNVQDVAVWVDSGFGSKSDAEVYQNCAKYGEMIRRDKFVEAIGWMPTKGMPSRKRWREKETGVMLPYYMSETDPFQGTSDAGVVKIGLFTFASDFYKDILQNLRKGKGGSKWSVSDAMSTEEYWRHLDGEVKTPVFSKATGRTTHMWQRRSKHWPNHMLDCEVLQVAAASYFRFLVLELEKG